MPFDRDHYEEQLNNPSVRPKRFIFINVIIHTLFQKKFIFRLE